MAAFQCNKCQTNIVLVTVKPFFSKEPSDVTVLKGQSVQFQCRVGGDPEPNILWRRDDGKMPIGRAQILDDKSLRIENVEPVDEGLYICDAENLVGSVSARASLTVHCECPASIFFYLKHT
jgi:roundabout axon guidance receptor 2